MAENILQKENEQMANLEFKAFIISLINLLKEVEKEKVLEVLKEILEH